MENKYECVICHEHFKGFGNNPAPVSETGRACSNCNAEVVIPARLERMGYKPKTAKMLGELISPRS